MNTVVPVPKDGERFDSTKAHVHLGSPWPVAVAGWTELPGYAQLEASPGVVWYRTLHKKGDGPDNVRFVIRDYTENHGVPISYLMGPMDAMEAYATAPYLFPPCFEYPLPKGAYFEVWSGLDAEDSVVEVVFYGYRQAFDHAAQVGGAIAVHLPDNYFGGERC